MNKLYKHLLLPQNYVAEEILIGIFLIYPNILHKLRNIIPKEYFFIEKNQLIYLNLTKILKEENKNIVEIFYELEYEKLLRKIGGLQSIMKIMKQSQIFICSYKIYNYVDELISILKNNYLKRLIIQFGYNLIKLGHIEKINNKHIYKKILSYINKIETLILKTNIDNIKSVKELISKKLIDIKYTSLYIGEKKKLIQSGLKQLDQILNELPQSSLIIIAGRPSIGKTSLAINIAYNAFFYQKINLLIFSLEMTSKDIFDKILSIGSNTNINEQNTDKLNKNQWNKISKICHKLLQANIYINEQNNINIKLIEDITKSIKKNMKLIF